MSTPKYYYYPLFCDDTVICLTYEPPRIGDAQW